MLLYITVIASRSARQIARTFFSLSLSLSPAETKRNTIKSPLVHKVSSISSKSLHTKSLLIGSYKVAMRSN